MSHLVGYSQTTLIFTVNSLSDYELHSVYLTLLEKDIITYLAVPSKIQQVEVDVKSFRFGEEYEGVCMFSEEDLIINIYFKQHLHIVKVFLNELQVHRLFQYIFELTS